MSSPVIFGSQSSLSPEEIELINQAMSGVTDPTKLTHIIQNEIKEKLHIERNETQIFEFINKKINNRESEDKEPIEEEQQVFTNLFKKFDEEQISSKPAMKRCLINFISTRKIPKRELTERRKNQTMQDRLELIEQINEECGYSYDKYDRKLNRKTSIKEQSELSSNVSWFYNEFFYSNYDRKFFDKKSMQVLYEQLQIESNEITYKSHRNILKALPRPNVFNDDFVIKEKYKLEEFRQSCRQTTKNLSKNNDLTTDFPVHSIVLALHPLCGHLHTGSIMAYYKENLYMVRFLKPELPAQKILDINMSTEFTNVRNKGLRNDLNFERNVNQSENAPGEIIEEINFEIAGFFIKLLSFKNDVVQMMKAINQRNQKKGNIVPEVKETHLENETKDKEAFQWLVRLVKEIDRIIQQVLVRFRLRGVNEGNSSSIFSNIRSLLLNPLKLMSKEFENSSEQTDMNAAEQIRSIISRERDNQITKALANAIMNFSQQNKENKINLTEKMNDLIKCCLGVLADLKLEGKSFNVESNSNLIRLGELSGEKNSEAFNEVYEKLFSIVAKIKE